jgi:hypothetical protein
MGNTAEHSGSAANSSQAKKPWILKECPAPGFAVAHQQDQKRDGAVYNREQIKDR